MSGASTAEPESTAGSSDSAGSDSPGAADSHDSAGSAGLRHSVVMAAGTVVSRLSGFVRIALLAACVGTGTRADVFTSANTIPNSLYILVAGGVFNAVLVPQLVRAIKTHDDRGQAFTDRIITTGLLLLAVVTVAAVLLAPYIARVNMPAGYFGPGMAVQRQEIEFFCRLTLPQIFFYGAYVLVGQVLNARGSFGPMMWTPIANNLVAIAAIVTFLAVYRVGDQPPTYTTSEQWLLGLGHTAGIAVQMVLLIPFLRASGYRFRWRFGLRNTGLGTTAKRGLWTIAFVAVNQVTLVIITRIALSASEGVPQGSRGAAPLIGGLTAYQNALLVFMLPHAIVTVSLATAALPAMSALATEGRLADVAREGAAATRQALSLVLPAAFAFFAFATPIMTLVAGWGASAGKTERMAQTLMALAPGLIAFTVQFLQLRTFYALDDTRTPFFIQIVIAAVNSTGAIVGTRLLADHSYASVVLGGAYSLAYVVGVLIGYVVLSRRTSRPKDARLLGGLSRTALAALVGVGAAWIVVAVVDTAVHADTRTLALARMAIAVVVCLPCYLIAARALRVREVAELTGLVTSRLPGRRRPTRRH